MSSKKNQEEKRVETIQANFLGYVVHEIQNDLMAAGMSARFVRNSAHLPEEEKEVILKNIEDSCSRAGFMLMKLNVLRNHLAEYQVFQWEKTDLRSLMEKLVEEFKRLSLEKEIALEYIEKTGEGPAIVNYDRKFLFLALSCLLDNAFQFSKKGQSVRLGLMKSHTEFVVEISDQGKGISEEDFPRIFEPYFPMIQKKHHRNIHPSMGLGLTFAREVIEKHGAILDIRSKPGRGTIVFIHFPSAVD